MFAGKNEITPYLVSRFYRAPEISKFYAWAIIFIHKWWKGLFMVAEYVVLWFFSINCVWKWLFVLVCFCCSSWFALWSSDGYVVCGLLFVRALYRKGSFSRSYEQWHATPSHGIERPFPKEDAPEGKYLIFLSELYPQMFCFEVWIRLFCDLVLWLFVWHFFQCKI